MVGDRGSCSFYTSEYISEYQRGDRGTAGILGCYNPGLFASHYCRISNISVGHIIFTLSGYDHCAMRSGNERSKVSS